MESRLQTFFVKLEALSLRERVLLLVGTPLMVALVLEGAVLSPARSMATTARKELALRTNEVQQLQQTLAARPAVGTLPAADQLRSQRDTLLRQVSEAETVLARLGSGADWSSVVRAAGSGTRGVVLTQVRTLAPELVFDPASALLPAAGSRPAPGAASAPAPAASAAALAGLRPVFRHRAELAMQGDFSAVMAYVQEVQQMRSGPVIDRLQVGVAAYPQATASLGLYTLSSRAETPYNP